MSLPIQPKIGFFKYIYPSLEEQISENDRNVKNLIKNIEKLNNVPCCRSCNPKSFQDIKSSLMLVDQKIQRVINQAGQVARKYLMSQKEKAFLDHSIQQVVLKRKQLTRRVGSLPQKCFWGSVKAASTQMGSFVSGQTKRIGVTFKPSRSWNQICPCVRVFGVGSALSYPFRLGILTGLVANVFLRSTICLIDYFHPLPSDNDSKYSESLKKLNLFHIVFTIPLVEEYIFRGRIQGSITKITNSPEVGIGVSAGLFGALHLSNDHKLRVLQAVITGLSGVLLGTLNYQLGFAASLGAHAMNNFLCLA